MSMTSALWRVPRRWASHDLTARQAMLAAVLAMAAITGLDLLDARLGAAFAIGFVLVVLTVAVAVRPEGFFAAGIFPPVLFALMMLAVSAFFGSALVIEGTPSSVGVLGRALSGTIAFGVPLLVGHALALAAIVVRVLQLSDQRP